jgi:hypothetical protein
VAIVASLRQHWLALRQQVGRDAGRAKDREHARNRVYYEMGGTIRSANSSWYRGENCNFHPELADLSKPGAIDQYVGLGWFPEKPFITKDHSVTTFGSCFARHITDYLVEQGYNVFGRDLSKQSYVIRCGEGMVNTAAIAQQFLWGYGEIEFEENLWYDKTGSVATYTDEVRSKTRAIFEGTDVFIITLGLSEVWYNKQTGDVFWASIPESVYDQKRHGFKIMDVGENKKNLQTIYQRIRKYRPRASIIFTLSPVPLRATFRPVSCITANSVSKAILRVAVDEFVREHQDDSALFYFPSYEIVKEFCRDSYEDDLRHIRRDVVELIMKTFHRHFLT